MLALIALSVAALAASKYTVTATIFNQNANNNPVTLQSDGSGSGVYSSSGGVDSELTPNAGSNNYYQWFLNLTSSSRSFYLTLTPLNGSPNVFSGTLPFNGQLVSRCFGANTSTFQNWTQIQFSDQNCAMRVTFTYQGITYTLVMSPDYPGTGTATVTCTNWSTKSKSCSAWTDVPTAGTNANISNLYGSGGALIGQYSLSFNITVTHP